MKNVVKPFMAGIVMVTTPSTADTVTPRPMLTTDIARVATLNPLCHLMAAE